LEGSELPFAIRSPGNEGLNGISCQGRLRFTAHYGAPNGVHHRNIGGQEPHAPYFSNQARPLEPLCKQWLMKCSDRLPTFEVRAIERDKIAIFSKWRRKGVAAAYVPAIHTILPLPNGIPSHDTFSRVLAHVKGEADYVIAAKGNQETLHNAIQQAFVDAQTTNFAGLTHDTAQTEETQNGRWERRTYWTQMEPAILAKVNPTGRWPKLNCIGMVRAERTLNGRTSVEQRFYISSLDGKAHTFGRAVRGHWGIENSVHWLLDLVFREDDCRISVGNGAENLAVLRHIALNLLRHERSSKQSLKQKRFRAALDTAHLHRLLGSAASSTEG